MVNHNYKVACEFLIRAVISCRVLTTLITICIISMQSRLMVFTRNVVCKSDTYFGVHQMYMTYLSSCQIDLLSPVGKKVWITCLIIIYNKIPP